MRCPRCYLANSASVPHSFAGEPCSRIPRPEFVPQRRNVDFREEDGLDRWSVADDLRGQVR